MLGVGRCENGQAECQCDGGQKLFHKRFNSQVHPLYAAVGQIMREFFDPVVTAVNEELVNGPKGA